MSRECLLLEVFHGGDVVKTRMDLAKRMLIDPVPFPPAGELRKAELVVRILGMIGPAMPAGV